MAALLRSGTGTGIRDQHYKGVHWSCRTPAPESCLSGDYYERLRGTNLGMVRAGPTLTMCPRGGVAPARGPTTRSQRELPGGGCTPEGYDWVYRKFILHPALGHKQFWPSLRRTGSYQEPRINTTST